MEGRRALQWSAINTARSTGRQPVAAVSWNRPTTGQAHERTRVQFLFGFPPSPIDFNGDGLFMITSGTGCARPARRSRQDLRPGLPVILKVMSVPPTATASTALCGAGWLAAAVLTEHHRRDRDLLILPTHSFQRPVPPCFCPPASRPLTSLFQDFFSLEDSLCFPSVLTYRTHLANLNISC